MLPTTPPLPNTSGVTETSDVSRSRTRLRVNEQQVRPTEADAALIRLVARFGYMTALQIHRALRPSARLQATYARLKRLERCGLMRCVTGRIPRDTRAVFMPTPAGYAWAGSCLTPMAGVSLALLEHTLAVGDVGTAYLRAGNAITTDRELRRDGLLARAGDPDARARMASWSATDSSHRPDLLLGSPDRAGGIAVEVELTTKSGTALRRVLRCYREASSIERVVYHVPSQAVLNGVWRAAREVNMDRRLDFVGYVPSHSREHAT